MKHAGDNSEDGWEDLLDGTNDLDGNLEEWLFKQGWCKITVEEDEHSVDAWTPDNFRKSLQYLQMKVSTVDKIYATIYTKAESAGLGMHEVLRGRDEINTFIKYGKKPKRTEVGSNLAMFR